MARRKKSKKIFTYNCTITGDSYQTTKEAGNPDELVCVEAFYEMHPELNDRPAHIQQEVDLRKKQREELKKQLTE